MTFREKLPIYYIAAASLYAVAGMGLGLFMHLTQWKRPVPFHGHLDSLGWLSLAVVGIVLHIYPWARDHKLAVVQFVLMQLGTLLLLGGLPLVFAGLTNISVTLGAVMVPLGFVVFSIVMLSGLRRGHSSKSASKTKDNI